MWYFCQDSHFSLTKNFVNWFPLFKITKINTKTEERRSQTGCSSEGIKSVTHTHLWDVNDEEKVALKRPFLVEEDNKLAP